MKTKLILLGCCIALAGCTGNKLDQAENTAPSGSEFEQALFSEYVNLSRGEYDEADYRDSDTFAGRALAVAGGQKVGPEEISLRNLPQEHVDELTSARADLVAALNGGGTTVSAAASARAQTMFDCWMQEQEENHQPDDIAACRDRFRTALATVQKDLGQTRTVSAVERQLVETGEVKLYGIRFALNSAEILDESIPVLTEVQQALANNPALKIAIEGHTDSQGEADYNQGLSERRAASVVAWLTKNGISADNLTSSGYGESTPVADNGTREGRALNRRVELKVLGDS